MHNLLFFYQSLREIRVKEKLTNDLQGYRVILSRLKVCLVSG